MLLPVSGVSWLHPIIGHSPLAQLGEQVATAVRDRERLAGANANGQSAVRRLLHDDDL